MSYSVTKFPWPDLLSILRLLILSDPSSIIFPASLAVLHILSSNSLMHSILLQRNVYSKRLAYKLQICYISRCSATQMIAVMQGCRRGGTGRRPGLKIPWVAIPVPVRSRSPAVREACICASLLFLHALCEGEQQAYPDGSGTFLLCLRRRQRRSSWMPSAR